MLNIVIPHNDTKKESGTLLHECMSAARIAARDISHDINVEFSAGRLFTETANAGIKKSANYKYTWILNDDAIANTNCVVAALEMMEAHENIGIVGSMNVSKDNHEVATWAGSGVYFPVGRHKIGSVNDFTFSREMWIPFSSVFIRSELFFELGLLDKRLMHICSDSDFCIRARCAGWKLWHNPDSIVYHDFYSSKVPEEKIKMQMKRDIDIFKSKNLSHIIGEMKNG